MRTISNNYTGRDLDLLILQGFDPNKQTNVELSLGSGLVCAGIQKVAQEFIILLLNGKGSNPWDPTRGTDFMSSIEKGLIYDETMLQAQFSFAVSDVFAYLEGKVGPEVPDDEILEDVELLEWDLRPGYISIKVKLTTAAGDSSVFLVPVSI